MEVNLTGYEMAHELDESDDDSSLFPDSEGCLANILDFQDGDGGIEQHHPKPKRKRQRLDHLSQDEKLMRRKMKNRVAAQSARDRKKVRMSELEKALNLLHKEKAALSRNNRELALRNKSLSAENQSLKSRLEKDEVVEGSKAIAFESAERTSNCGRPPTATNNNSLLDDVDYALQHADFPMDLLDEINDKKIVEILAGCDPRLFPTEELSEAADNSIMGENTSSTVVGTAAEYLGSVHDSSSPLTKQQTTNKRPLDDCCLVFPLKQEVFESNTTDELIVPIDTNEVIISDESTKGVTEIHPPEEIFLQIPNLLSPMSNYLSESGYDSSPDSAISFNSSSSDHGLSVLPLGVVKEEPFTDLFPDLM